MNRNIYWALALAASCSLRASAQYEHAVSSPPFVVPLGLEAPIFPKDNPLTPARVALGKLLFFDKRLSRDSSVNCATCHSPKLGWTDHRPTVLGIREQIGDRNAPTLLNAAYQTFQFWDGRALSLEAQAKEPIANPKEMDLPHAEAVARISQIAGYAPYFTSAFGDATITIDRIAQAIASFERTLLSGNSPYDRYMAGDHKALSRDALRGLKLFEGRANCAACHTGPNFTDGRFHNIGVGIQRRAPEMGRYTITSEEADRGAFKTPTLRNLTNSYPYMHDGSEVSLKDVIDYFDRGGRPNQWLSPKIKPLKLSAREKRQLLAFLQSLDGDQLVIEPPPLPQ